MSTLRAFLGQMTYYTHFINNLSTISAPLNKLLKKDQPWSWGEEHSKAFKLCKQALRSDSLCIKTKINLLFLIVMNRHME